MDYARALQKIRVDFSRNTSDSVIAAPSDDVCRAVLNCVCVCVVVMA